MSQIAKQFGYPGAKEKNIDALIDFINSFSDVIEFEVVTAGTEVAISHGLEAIPRDVFPVVKENSTVSFANVYAGSTAWTTSKVYLTASLPGKYYVILRR